MAPRAQCRGLRIPLVLVCAVHLASAVACRPNPSDRIDASWTLEPSPPSSGAPLVARVTLSDRSKTPIIGAKLRLEGQMSHPGMTPVVADFTERGEGVYEARLQLTMAGDWILVVSGQLRDGTHIVKQIDLAGVRPAG
jgi:YtkA-like